MAMTASEVSRDTPDPGPAAARPAAAPPPRGRHPHHRTRSPTRSRRTPARSAARWATTSRTPCRWRWPASSGWPRAAAAPPTPARPCPRRSRAPTRWAAARRAAAGAPTRCSRPTASAPAWPGASSPRPRSRRASRPTCWPSFAELVFAYIDELSAASVAGHADELETTGRVRQRYLDRLALGLLRGDPADALVAAAERADWTPPKTLTAVIAAQRPGPARAGPARPAHAVGRR